MKIGIFDSGVGALSVYREVRKAFPKVDIDYFGDTLRMPYGSKTPEEIQKFTLEIGTYLVKEGAEALIIACNTATAYGLNALEKAFPEIPVYGMIEQALPSNSTSSVLISFPSDFGDLRVTRFTSSKLKLATE